MQNSSFSGPFGHSLGFLSRIVASPTLAAAVTAAAICLMPSVDNSLQSLPFATSVFVALALIIFVVSRRPVFSVYGAWAIVFVVTIVSGLKFYLKGFSLHFYDIVVMASDREMHKFLLSSYLHIIAPVLFALCAMIALLALIYRRDPIRTVPLQHRVPLLLLPAVALPLTLPADATEDQRYFYYLLGRHSTAFFVSFLDAASMFSPSPLEARIARIPPQPPFSGAVDCGTGPKPDVFVVLSESFTDPRLFADVKHSEAMAKQLTSAAGALHPLQVESFGGGTWISNLSFMTGLSATDFGWRSPYLTISLEGQVKATLPAIFAECGYRTAALLPMNYSFVNEGPFLSSIGFETVLDKDAIGADHYHLRDNFYFDAAERFLADHRAHDGRPLFLLIETMFAHSPYEERLAPEIDKGVEGFHTDPLVDEYLRRMSIAIADLEIFAKRRNEERETRPNVLVTFGDHQSSATRSLVLKSEGLAGLADPASVAYRTYYTATGHVPFATTSPIDIAFLGTRVLRAANIPGNAVFQDLARLEALCGGHFFLCPERREIDLHLRRRIDSGMLTAEGLL